MKIRHGFVSNSSSTSFTCDVCGEEVGGMDMGLSEAEMYECSMGHLFCESHATKNLDIFTVDEKRAYLIATQYNRKEQDFWDKASEEEVEDAFEDYKSEARYEWPVSSCPCCTLESITKSQILEYLLKSKNLTREDVEAEIRSKYKNYAEMRKDLDKGKV